VNALLLLVGHAEQHGDGARGRHEVRVDERWRPVEALVDRVDIDGRGSGRSVGSRHRFFLGIAPRT